MTDFTAAMSAMADRQGREATLPADHPLPLLLDVLRRELALPARHASNEVERQAILAQLRKAIEQIRRMGV